MKRLIRKITVVLAAIGCVLTFASPASADDTICNTDSNGTETCLTFSNMSVAAATDQESSSVHAVSKSSSGVRIFIDVKLSGTRLHSPKCHWIKAGWNSMEDANGNLMWFWDSKPMKICPNSNSPTGWVKVAGGRTGRNCGNPVRVHNRPPVNRIVKGKFELLTHFTFVAKVSITSHSNAAVDVKAQTHNSDNSCVASASAHSTASASASASASAKGSTAVSAKANAETQIKTQLHEKVQTQASANARTSASAKASAEAFCSPPQQNQQTPPSVVSMTQLNDVNAGETSPNYCATVNVPGSDSGTLMFSAKFGSFTSSTFTVNGMQQECTTYVAPTEVPPGGKDTVTVFVRDNTTGLSAQEDSQPFTINPPPHPPV